VTLTHGTNRLLGLRIDALQEIPRLLGSAPSPLRPPPGWDGRAGERVAAVIADALGENAAGAHAGVAAAV
jgi:hypothetical protein